MMPLGLLNNRASIKFLKKTFLIFIIIGVFTMYFFGIPKYLEKRIKANSQLEIQGSNNVEITGYSTYVTRSTIPGFPYIFVALVEVFNKSDAPLELLEINSSLINRNGKSAYQLNLMGSDTYVLRMVDTTYYDALPSRIGLIIPPGGKLPIEIWQGALLPDDPNQFTPDENGRNKLNLLFYWNMFGLPLLQWDRLEATVVVRPVGTNVAEWYQYWDNIPVKLVQNPRQFGQACTFDLFAQIDPNPIFDNLFEKYGNKGMPNPYGPGRIISDSNGEKTVLHTFRPKLEFVVTIYDEYDNFVGGYRTVSLEKDPYKTVDADGYFQIGSDVPCDKRIKKFNVLLEVVPEG